MNKELQKNIELIKKYHEELKPLYLELSTEVISLKLKVDMLKEEVKEWMRQQR